MSDIKMYDGHGRCYSADQIAQIARFIEGGRPEGLRLYPINGAPGRFLVDAEQFDAQRLRADTAEAENRLLRHSNASFLEMVAKVCDLLGIDLDDAKHADGQPSDVLLSHARNQAEKLAVAEQRIAKMAKVLTDIRQSCELSHLRDSQIDAALNQKSEGESHA